MNREIKFRAYDKGRKEYLSAGSIFLSIQPGVRPAASKQYLDEISQPNAYASRFVIEQFIGIKDRTGKDIYENDIVACNYNSSGRYRAIVTYEKERCSWLPLCLTGISQIEVIGNIHDNPDLIKN